MIVSYARVSTVRIVPDGAHIFADDFILALFADCWREIRQGLRGMVKRFGRFSNPSARHSISPLAVRIIYELQNIGLAGHPRFREITNVGLAVFGPSENFGIMLAP